MGDRRRNHVNIQLRGVEGFREPAGATRARTTTHTHFLLPTEIQPLDQHLAVAS